VDVFNVVISKEHAGVRTREMGADVAISIKDLSWKTE